MRFIIFIIIFLVSLPIVFSQGFTVSSVSTTSTFTHETSPSEEYWIVETQLNGGGQSIFGVITPDDIKNKMGGKVYTEKPFSISVSSVGESMN